MTNATNSTANFINECNISFKSGDFSSDSSLLLLHDFLNNSSYLSSCVSLPYIDFMFKILRHNSNHSIFTQQVIRFLTGFNSQTDQSILQNDPLLSKCLGQFSLHVFCFPFSRINEKCSTISRKPLRPSPVLWLTGSVMTFSWMPIQQRAIAMSLRKNDRPESIAAVRWDIILLSLTSSRPDFWPEPGWEQENLIQLSKPAPL